MEKLVRYGWQTLKWLIGIIVLVWLILLAFVHFNERRLIGKLAAALQQQTRGEVSIGGLSVSLIRTFPVLTLQLKELRLRDSLYAIHQKDLLAASDVFVSFDILKRSVGRVVLQNASIHILTDSTGYSNAYVLKSKEEGKEKKNNELPVVIMRNTKLTYTDDPKFKFHQTDIRNARCRFTQKGEELTMHLSLDMVVQSLGFNMNKGSYLKNKRVEGRFTLLLDQSKNDLIINNIRLLIDKHPYDFKGRFHIDTVSPDFVLTITTENLKYEKAISILSDTLESRFNAYLFKKPMNFFVQLNGKTLYKYAPAARIITEIDLDAVNNFGSTVFDLIKGRAAINILLNGPNGRHDSLVSNLEGRVDIKGAEVKYHPRGFVLSDLNGSLKFADEDLIVEKFVAHTGKTKLEMSGIARSFVSILNKEPEKMDMRWKIYSPKVDMADFTNFLSPAEVKTQTRKDNADISRRIDKVFTEGEIYVDFSSPSLSYKGFHASSARADVVLKRSAIVLERAKLTHANGTIEVDGSMTNGANRNPLHLRARLTNMDIPRLFQAFNNFGQYAITYKNLNGKLSAMVDLKAAVANDATMITDETLGTVHFTLEDGELNNFWPLQELGSKVFKKQNFDRINFATIENTLEIRKTAFIINAMDIRSSALNFSVQGIYDVKEGTDMSIVLPLKNLTKSQADTDLADDVKLKKGVSLRLRAKTDEDKKLRITWDPFGRALKHIEEKKQ